MTMLFRHRHRRPNPYQYQLSQPSGVPIGLQRLLVLLVLGAMLWWAGKAVLGLFGFNPSLDRLPTSLTTEERGLINVSLQGADLQTAEDGMMLFPGDGLKTGPNAHASLHFFDETLVRLDVNTDLVIDESGRGEEESEIRLAVNGGGVWMATPRAATATGTTVYELAFPAMTLRLTPGSEVIAGSGTIIVYSAEGQGVEVDMQDLDPFYIGEGQQWILPAGTQTVTDPYAYRSPVTDSARELALLTDSRKLLLGGRSPSAPPSAQTGSGDVLVLTEPAAEATVAGDVLTIRGTVNASVASVTVNGHQALLDRATGRYSLELALPEGEDELELGVEARDGDGTALSTIKRIVKLGGAAPAPNPAAPVIETPAKAGETYNTNATEVIIRGKAPARAAGIQVNDYRLQLFTPEKGEWSYIASADLGNLKPGTNTYDVIAILDDGTRSPAARITIVQGQGDTGVTSSAAATPSSAAAASSVPLTDNAPLTPGILAVTAPTAGSFHTETGTGFLLEGKTSAATDSMWVSGYRLQLYKPGVTFWNYIAETKYGNLKPGTNSYEIVARDKEGKVLDRLVYVVELKSQAAASSGQ